jgi:hypothetical protein
MSATATGVEGTLCEVVDSMCETLRVELGRTRAERDALDEFATRITDLELSNNPVTSASRRCAASSMGGALAQHAHSVSGPPIADERRAIRTAYEATVMSVPFYEAEYGDTYEESIRAEFGPEIATALTRTESLNHVAKQGLLAKIEQSRKERDVLLETCERELDSVGSTASVLEPIDEELRSIERISFPAQEFGQLEAHRTRLLTMKDTCEDAARDRQATIHEHRTAYNHTIDVTDIYEYLYDSFEFRYPLLSLCTELAQRIEQCRRQVETAMSGH